MTIERLPTEILVKIFRYLITIADRFHLAMTCKKLMKIFRRCSVLWRSFSFALCNHACKRRQETPEPVMERILCSGNLRFVNISYDSCPHETQKVCQLLTKLAATSRNLLALNFSAPIFPEEDTGDMLSAAVVRVFENCPSLKTCDVNNTPLKDEAMISLSRVSGSRLNSLDIQRCRNISPAGVLSVTTQCRNLQQLVVDYCNLSTEAIVALASADHVRIRHLEISVTQGTVSHEIQPTAWRKIEQHSPQMKLTFKFICLTDEEFNVFFNGRNPVTSLIVCQTFSKAFLVRIAKCCPLLEEFSLCGTCPGAFDSAMQEALICTARNCTKLKRITLSGFFISCHVIEEIARASGPRLEEFSIQDLFLEENDVMAYGDRQDEMCERVSQYLGRCWSPIPTPVLSY